jgi:asparagine synthetase B (glutamine-hydrolysing)
MPIAPAGLVEFWRGRPWRAPVLYEDLDPRTLELVDPEFRGSEADADAGRASRWSIGTVLPREEHRWAVTSPSNALVLEIEDRVTAAFGIEARYPFLDKRLIEFAIAVPTAEKIQGGWTRSLIRRAMAGVLPDVIRWRSGKGHLETWYFRALLKYERRRLERMVYEDAELLRPYINLAALRVVYEQYRATGDGTSALLLWNPLVLAHWLRQERADHSNGDPTIEKGGAHPRTQLAVPQAVST